MTSRKRAKKALSGKARAKKAAKKTAKKAAKRAAKKAKATKSAKGAKASKVTKKKVAAKAKASTRATKAKASKSKTSARRTTPVPPPKKAKAPAKPAAAGTKAASKTATAKTTATKVKTTTKATRSIPAPPPKQPKLGKDGLPTKLEPVAELEGYPTESLWGFYRKATKDKEKNALYIEELRNLLIERHYPLVRYIAERLLQTLPKSIELDDLISAGLFGLMDAIRGFDPDRGIKFKTYCSTRIRGSILDQLRSQDWVPRLVRLKAGKIERALQKLTGEYGREPTHAELARTLEMDHDELVREMQDSRAKTMFSLSEKWEDDDGSVEKVEILEDKHAIDPVFELNRRDLMGFITRSLTHKERFIIEQYYQYGHTMREIGEMLALTESRVCQIHSNVMSRLKGLLGVREDSLLS